MNAPVTFYNQQKAQAAYERYSALRQAERDCPALADEECFQVLMNDAYRAFETAFCAPSVEIAG